MTLASAMLSTNPGGGSSDDLARDSATSAEPAPQFGKRTNSEGRLTHFDWEAAGMQSFFFLATEHAVRMSQSKTRQQLGGPFFKDYFNAVAGLGGWGDSDGVLTNYIGHPAQGGLTGFIAIQNDPRGIGKTFNDSSQYWHSRLRAMAFAAAYSAQFELGPVSEASIGNVGNKRGTMGFVDLVMTPVGGFGFIVAEDAIDKYWIMNLERGKSDGAKRFYRMVLNPERTIANLLRFKKPWYRDTRSMSWDQ